MVETFGEQEEKGGFARRLGLIGATNIGLGAMLGGGIYVISGAAAGIIGPAVVLAYLVTGVMTVFTAINYAELACSIPKQGGGYTFAHDTFGGFPAFLTGWFLFIGNLVACGLYALAVAHTIAVFIPGVTEQTIGLIAIVIIIVTFITNLVSIKGVSGVLGILNIAQAFVLFSFILVGLFYVQPTNLEPLFRAGAGPFEFMATVAFIYISFVGFELITTASEEIKEPARNIPRAIMLTLLIATIVYMLAALVIVGAVPYTTVADSYTPISDVFGFMLGPGAFYLGLAGMAASNYAALNATFLASARVIYSLGRDRYFPKVLENVSPKFKTPIPALIVTLIAVSIFAASGNVDLVASVADFGYLIGLAIVNASVIILHQKRLSVPGTFKAPYYPVIPILGVITCLVLIPFLHVETLYLGTALAALGLVIYLGYSRSRNKQHVQEVIVMTLEESIESRKEEPLLKTTPLPVPSHLHNVSIPEELREDPEKEVEKPKKTLIEKKVMDNDIKKDRKKDTADDEEKSEVEENVTEKESKDEKASINKPMNDIPEKREKPDRAESEED